MKLTKIERIECYGKGVERWYFPKDLTLGRWENFLQNKISGNEDFLYFVDNDGTMITLNPSLFASVEVYKHD